MTEKMYHIRWRGKESGPFSLPDIHTMLARNELSLLHQVGVGGKWVPLEDLIKIARAEEARRVEAAPQSATVTREAPQKAAPPPIPREQEFYVAKDGVKQGPLTKTVVQQLLAAGVFHHDDLAWREGIPSWQPLFQLVEIPLSSPTATSLGLHPPSPNSLPADRSSSRLATGMAAFAMYHSHEVRKELRELNQNLEELQSDADSGDVSDGGSWDFSGM
jgi:hypothetical protein